MYFRETVEHPIFTFTFKTVQGTDVTGTNTMIENVLPDKGAAGELYEVCFTQDMDLQGGEYLLSISCTGFEQGELKAHHRLYDLLSVTVVSDKDTVGVYDMRSKTTVRKIGEDT